MNITVNNAMVIVNTMAKSSWLNTSFIVCLVLGIVCLALAVLFFFLFDIPNVYLVKTGKGARRTIKKMEEINAETGRLRRVNEEYMVSAVGTGTTAETGEQRRDPNVNIPFKPVDENIVKSKDQVGKKHQEGENQTTVLGQQGSTLLSTNETTVLNADMLNNETNVYTYTRETNGRFDVTFKLIYTHSDELI